MLLPITILFLSLVAQGQEVRTPAIRLSSSSTAVSSGDTAILNEMVNAPVETPVGPYELLHSYESEMASISEQLDSELLQILAAVQKNQLDPEAGDYLSEHRFQVAMMRYHLLSVLHADLAKRIQDAEQQEQENSPETDDSAIRSGAAMRQTGARVTMSARH
jgi:hypothetical protein